MQPHKIVNEFKEKAFEYLEMSDNPDAFLCHMMANEIIKLQNHINYLEKRFNYVTFSKK